MKKIIMSIAVIAATAAIVVGATTAFFSDSEISTGNTFTAGTIDIELDDINEPFVDCEAITDSTICNDTARCEWLDNKCVQATEGVTASLVIKDWKPSQIWNPGIISIHNNGTNPIDQLILFAPLVDDSDDGLTPESEPNDEMGTGGGDLMVDDIEIIFVEQWLFPVDAWENKEVQRTFTNWAKEFAIGEQIPTWEQIAMIQEDLAALGVSVKFVDLTENFREVYDKMCGNQDNIVTLDELAKGRKNILAGEILSPSEVKIIIPHFHFASEAGNNLQGDVVKFDLTFEAMQIGAEPGETCIERPNIIR